MAEDAIGSDQQTDKRKIERRSCWGKGEDAQLMF
jgi:hypothetical protein